MGTRHLIAVVKDNDYKVAQYGQWDGYLDGQGQEVVDFLRDRLDREKFEIELAKITWLTDEQIEKVEGTDNWTKEYPYLSRDCGASILDHVQDGDIELGLNNSVDFAGDSLFCEWAYVINLDTNELEIYKGFNDCPPNKGERFADIPVDEPREGQTKYFPILHFHTFKFSELIDFEDFVKQWIADENDKDE